MNTDADRTISTTIRAAKILRLGQRRLTRAHLALQKRPALVEAFCETANAIACALKVQLAADIEVTGQLLQAVFRPAQNLSADAALLVIELDAIGTCAVLELERGVLGAALDRISGAPTRAAPMTRLTRIEESAFGFLALVMLQAARGNATTERLFAPRLRAVNPDRREVVELIDAGTPHIAAQLQLRVGAVQGQARLFIPARALQNAVQAEPLAAVGAIEGGLLSAAICTRAFLGRSVLDATDLETLRRGDVVLFDDLRLEEGRVIGAGRLSAPGFELFGDFAAPGFTFTRALTRNVPQESFMSQPNQKSDAPSLPVDVEIELARLRLTVAELASIRPGAILPLHINATEPVLLRVGDRAVARAELVEIDGEVGARILTLFS